MQTKTNIKTVFTQEPTKLKLHLSRQCESKIRTACQVFPNTEWSGAAFYKYIKKADNTTNMEETELMVVDFTLQDIGSAGYTEYSLDKETAAYYADHIDTLLGCKVMLLHSHNNMASYFSCTDMSTLKEQAEQCNNVLSLVVNNAGGYVAKFTERHKVHKDIAITQDITTIDSWKYMGEKEDSNTEDSTEHDDRTYDYIEVKCWDCDIDRPLDVTINEDFKKECIEKIDLFKKKKEEEKSIKLTNRYRDVSHSPQYYQSNLFGDEWDNIKTDKATTIRCMINSLFELSFTPSCGYYYCADYLTDELSLDFIQLFINAWLAYYEPDTDDLQKVIDEFSLRTEGNCDYPQTRDAILSYLTEIHEEYLDMELEDDKQ